MWYIVGAVVVILALCVAALIVLRARRKPPLVSIVLLRSRKPALSKEQLTNAYRRAYNVEPRIEPLALDEHSVGHLFIPHDGPPIAIISAGRPYMEPGDAVQAASEMESAIARSAMTEHIGWFAVDAFGIPAGISADELAQVHAHIGKLAAELVDDETMLLYLPASNRIGEATPRNADLLREGSLAEVFGDEALHAPIVNVEADDAAIEKAKQEARRRLPELLTAFDARRAETAMIKAGFTATRGGQTGTEYIWILLTSIEDDGLVGTLANPPLDPAVGKKGDTVKVPIDRVMDWAYIDEKKKPHGLFVERLLTANR